MWGALLVSGQDAFGVMWVCWLVSGQDAVGVCCL